MGERPTIAFRANSLRQKAEWERAVAESDEYDSMSHLIRRSVSRELAGGYSPSSGDSGVSSERSDTLTESVERMEKRLKDVSDSVGRLENHTYAEGGLSDETLQAVFTELPVGEGEAVSGTKGTTEEIAERAGVAEPTAEMALEQLRNDMKGSVKRVEHGSDRFWFREA